MKYAILFYLICFAVAEFNFVDFITTPSPSDTSGFVLVTHHHETFWARTRDAPEGTENAVGVVNASAAIEAGKTQSTPTTNAADTVSVGCFVAIAALFML